MLVLIWEESSLKDLLCIWQRKRIVRSEATIKVKGNFYIFISIFLSL